MELHFCSRFYSNRIAAHKATESPDATHSNRPHFLLRPDGKLSFSHPFPAYRGQAGVDGFGRYNRAEKRF